MRLRKRSLLTVRMGQYISGTDVMILKIVKKTFLAKKLAFFKTKLTKLTKL
jgi:hypothetical protein